MDAHRITYPPLDTPKPVADDIWIVDSGPISAMGIPLPVRMTVIRLPDASLLLHSPTRFDAGLAGRLEELGPIRHLVAPDIAHWTYVKEWQDRIAGVTTWAAPGLRKRQPVRRSGLRIDHDLAGHAPDTWADVIDHVMIRGFGGYAEVAFFHRPTRTLVLTDLVQNLEREKVSPLMRPLAAAAGVLGPNGRAPAYLRMSVKLKRQAAHESATRLLALGAERVIFSHGRWFESDAAARLERSIGWML